MSCREGVNNPALFKLSLIYDLNFLLHLSSLNKMKYFTAIGFSYWKTEDKSWSLSKWLTVQLPYFIRESLPKRISRIGRLTRKSWDWTAQKTELWRRLNSSLFARRIVSNNWPVETCQVGLFEPVYWAIQDHSDLFQAVRWPYSMTQCSLMLSLFYADKK